MENFIFEGQVTFTKDIIKKSLKAWFYKSKLWLFFLIPIIIIILGIVVTIQGGDTTGLGLGIFMAIVFASIILIRYVVDVNIIYKRMLEQNSGKEVTNNLQIFNDTILVINTLTNNKINYDYKKIKKVLESKDLIILITEAKIMIIFEKTKFIVGNPNELVAFIKSKL